MLSPVRTKPSRARSVFINCPFDPEYKPLLRAACFAIMACGYAPRCALDYSDSGVVRFTEIVNMLTACDPSIHDISRAELDRTSRLPRFNMPLELGADLGLRLAGPRLQRRRKSLILDTEAHRYDKTRRTSLAWISRPTRTTRAKKIIRLVRDWLNANRDERAPPLPAAAAINGDHYAYQAISADIVGNLRLDPHDDLPHADYLHIVAVALPLIEVARAGALGARRG
jgi:hypothetical protein